MSNNTLSKVPEVELRDSRFDEDKYGFIEELRAKSYYARTPSGGVIFFNQEDVFEVFQCKDFRFTFDNINEERSPYLANAIKHELLSMHASRHARLSRLVKLGLRDRIISNIQADISGIVDKLIRDFPKDGKVNFCTAFADPLPGRVLGPMFGVPYESVKSFNEWVRIGGRKIDALQTGTGIEAVEDANRNMHNYLRELLIERRTSLESGQPGTDLFSELMQAEVDGDRLTTDELVYLTTELASAGVDTTRTQLPLILLALLNHPQELAKLQANPNLALKAVDEGMRFAPLPWAIPHAATRDFTYKTIDFKCGDLVFVLVPAANRDPAAVEAPQEFSITRHRVRNFSFGSGMHACPGAHLARLEMSIALKHLLAPEFEMTLNEGLEWESGQKGRGLKNLPIERKLRS